MGVCVCVQLLKLGNQVVSSSEEVHYNFKWQLTDQSLSEDYLWLTIFHLNQFTLKDQKAETDGAWYVLPKMSLATIYRQNIHLLYSEA